MTAVQDNATSTLLGGECRFFLVLISDLRSDQSPDRVASRGMARFIVTEATGAPGEVGELAIIDALRPALSSRDTVVFWRYPLNTRQGQLREPDLLLLDPEWGVVVIEVKNIPMGQIESIQGYAWRLSFPYFDRSVLEPYDQAKQQARVLIERMRDHPTLSGVPVRALVALPRVTRDEWNSAGQSFLFNDTPCYSEMSSPQQSSSGPLSTHPACGPGMPWTTIRSRHCSRPSELAAVSQLLR
ncbi:nuclease-related domain-containing protein [Deinococcus caeni]|uniref:nuclease-related domain-containing protein n=1 Tax=Deinococcus caeni TaxID=569127 RepID=UPI00361D655F